MAWTQAEKDQAIAGIEAAAAQLEIVKDNIRAGRAGQTLLSARNALSEIGGALISASFLAGT